ncbi:calmodulin-like protein 4 [Ambystoma mexicanum]|uniref:calmodulin-like protein 4 n=1 Tax=Ambystoma mexicanum TaxID=8296 RepID=UPI0037E7F50E
MCAASEGLPGKQAHLRGKGAADVTRAAGDRFPLPWLRIYYPHRLPAPVDFGTSRERAWPGVQCLSAPGASRKRGSQEAGEMTKFLSQDEINEFKECFSLYDRGQKGKIKGSDLITVMRCLGVCPTPSEVNRHLQVHKIERTGEVDFSTFLTMMYRQKQQEDPTNEILVALLMTDHQKKGSIPASELRAKLMQMGEKLTEQEVDELLKEANVGPDGSVKYEDFVRRITSPVPDY